MAKKPSPLLPELILLKQVSTPTMLAPQKLLASWNSASLAYRERPFPPPQLQGNMDSVQPSPTASHQGSREEEGTRRKLVWGGVDRGLGLQEKGHKQSGCISVLQSSPPEEALLGGNTEKNGLRHPVCPELSSGPCPW